MKLFGRRYFHLVKGLTTPENTITYHNALCLSPQNFAEALFSVSPGAISNSQEKLKTILMQKFGVTNKEHYGMLWYFLNEKVLCIARKREDIYVVFLFYPFLPIFPLACSRRWDSWVRRERRTVTSCPFGFFSAHISLRSSRSERLQLYNCSLRNRRLEVVGARRTGAQEEDTGVSLSCARSFLRPLLETWKRLRRVWPLCPSVNRDL